MSTASDVAQTPPTIAQGAKAEPASRYVMIESTTRRDSQRAEQPRRLVRTVEEASTLLGISRAHGYRLISRGQLRHIRLGRRILVPDRAIEDLLDTGGPSRI
jgi:excisionase family DNA binding protein